MIDTSFYKLVEEMRSLQKEYFKTRSKETLLKCKNLESAVDSILKFNHQPQILFQND